MTDETELDTPIDAEAEMADPAESALSLDEHDTNPRAESTDDPSQARAAADLEYLFDVPVRVSAVLGSSRMQVSELLKIGTGSVLELDRKVGEAIEIFVNDRLIARGEVVLVDDKLGITMTEIIKQDRG
ncbi:MAG: flagellar motor switch protein FliN [Hyphomicrobiales bacterium]|nr:flagellar motor switch protein FliN [Hyphomicrobiales bacterium]